MSILVKEKNAIKAVSKRETLPLGKAPWICDLCPAASERDGTKPNAGSVSLCCKSNSTGQWNSADAFGRNLLSTKLDHT